MTAKAKCTAVTLWEGKRTRCTVQTALRRNVVEHTETGLRVFGPEDQVTCHYVPVCSKHTDWVESHGWAWIDHEAVTA